MVNVAIVGLGKMGISHLSILNAHPDVNVVGACDSSAYVTDTLTKFTGLRCFKDYERMLSESAPDAVVVATPSHLHASMVQSAIDKGLHVFCEKPFVLDVDAGERLVSEANTRRLVTQVGYHNRFVGSFQEASRLIGSGALGDIHHVRVEAYGPVVLRPTGSTWRSAKKQGGGALYDYACHALDLVNYVVGCPEGVSGVVRGSIFSRDVDDEVYATLLYESGISGQLCVNWSDESHRKMSTRIFVWGTNGRLTADRQECQVYLRRPCNEVPDVRAGWSIKYTTELTDEVWFYVRGEEYSAQVDYFVNSIKTGRLDGLNSFSSALAADRLVAMIAAGGTQGASTQGRDNAAAKSGGLLGRLFR